MNKHHLLKTAAKGNLKRHYRLFIIICLISALLGAEYSGAILAAKVRVNDMLGRPTQNSSLLFWDTGIADVTGEIIFNNTDKGRELSKQLQEKAKVREEHQPTVLGTGQGVLAHLLNGISSGSLVVYVAEFINGLFHSEKVTSFILLIVSFLLLALWWTCVRNTYRVIYRRFLLEGRLYEELPAHRFFYLKDVGKWGKVSVSVSVMLLFQILWAFTIVGGFIKRYSYFLTPYILAENPDIGALEAINLSRRLMLGHKWECFLLELSFAGWWILSVLSAGLVGIFFGNAYQAATFCEYYVERREKGLQKQVPGSELLNDRALFYKADQKSLDSLYLDVDQKIEEAAAAKANPVIFHRCRRFCSEVLGIAFFDDETEKAYRRQQEALIYAEHFDHEKNGMAYPTRLSPLHSRQSRFYREKVHYIRHYSPYSLILMFFIFSFAGWCWEICLFLITEGIIINRGVLHGPWLPVYGVGGVFVLVIPNKLRKKPVAEFFGILLLCAVVEYGASLALSLLFDGATWWSYTGYFLNIQGRVCAEGLLTFAVGGMAVVYLLAPRIDNFLHKIKGKYILPLCLCLLLLFAADMGYSAFHPNVGKGITDESHLPGQEQIFACADQKNNAI